MPSETSSHPPQARLFRKYVALFVGLVSAAVITGGLVQGYFTYQASVSDLGQIQHEQATMAAVKIGQFIGETQRQIEDAIPPPWLADQVDPQQRETEYRRLLRRAPAITEVRYIDASGHEQLRVSRLRTNVIGSGEDFSEDVGFLQAKAERIFYSNVYFVNESEPHMAVDIGEGGQNGGVTVSDLNLKLVGDLVSQIKVGQAGYAYVVDSNGRLVAHPDIELVLQKTDLSALTQVQQAIAGPVAPTAQMPAISASDIHGRSVLSAHDRVDPPGWWVFVEQPTDEVFPPVYAALARTALLLFAGLVLSVVLGLILTRRMVAPIQALRQGAALIGAGALEARIDISTGDELEALAHEFNRMGARLQESYASLEDRVHERTVELAATLRELSARSRELEVVSQHKSEFLAQMSHELRTPLHSIIGFSELLLDQTYGELNERQARYEQHVMNAGRHLLSLINDMLDLSKIEAGHMELDYDRFVLSDVLEAGLAMVREQACRRGITLQVDVDPAIGTVDADERKLRQVVFNLLSNALKFTPEGGQVEVVARLVGDEVHIAVHDTGIGIREEDRGRIFEPFRQGARIAGQPYEGTGLGLSLAKEFVELQGGRIWLESEAGVGSTFTFALPLRATLVNLSMAKTYVG